MATVTPRASAPNSTMKIRLKSICRVSSAIGWTTRPLTANDEATTIESEVSSPRP